MPIINLKIKTIMANVSIYLNFAGNAEEAFNHYKNVFKSEFSTPLMRMKDHPPTGGAPALPEANKAK
jgi:PhnB protein